MARTKKSLPGGIKRPHRDKPGRVALREKRKIQKATDLLIPKLAFGKLVREIAFDIPSKLGKSIKFQSSALGALQVATEFYIVQHFHAAHLGTIHAKRITLMARHMQHIKDIKNLLNVA